MTQSTPLTVELLKRAQAGDAEAANRLFERYYGSIRRIVRIRLWSTTPRLRSRQSEIVQETLCVALEKLEGFEYRNESSLISWLARIAENQIRSQRQRRSVQLVRSEQDAVDSQGIEPARANSVEIPLDLAVRNETKAIFDSCIARLPAQYREVIIQRHFARPPGARRDVPWKSVAEEIGLPNGDAARKLYVGARIKLGRLLAQEGLGPESGDA